MLNFTLIRKKGVTISIAKFYPHLSFPPSECTYANYASVDLRHYVALCGYVTVSPDVASRGWRPSSSIYLPTYKCTNWYVLSLLSCIMCFPLSLSLSPSLPLSFSCAREEMPWRYVPVDRALRLRTEFSIGQSLRIPIVPRLYDSIKFPRNPVWLRKSGI